MARTMLAILAPIALLLLSVAARVETPLGLWESGESHIEIYHCGELLCGRIAALDEPLDKDGNPKLDDNNPDPALRTRPILGMDLIADFSRKSDRKWVNGTIYDPARRQDVQVQDDPAEGRDPQGARLRRGLPVRENRGLEPDRVSPFSLPRARAAGSARASPPSTRRRARPASR